MDQREIDESDAEYTVWLALVEEVRQLDTLKEQITAHLKKAATDKVNEAMSHFNKIYPRRKRVLEQRLLIQTDEMKAHALRETLRSYAAIFEGNRKEANWLET